MSEWTKAQRRWLRGGLAVLALTPALVGIWALVTPRGFYEDFPGGDRMWVSKLGPYNEHLVRDVGALYLGTLVILVLAWVWLDRRLVMAALIGVLVGALPHLVYHLTALEDFSTADAVAEIAGLAVSVVLPLVLLVVAVRRPRAEV
jgi:hypothetical protein